MEFNLLYRFHSAISQRDAKWTDNFLNGMFPGQDIANLAPHEFAQGLGEKMASISNDPSRRTFHDVDGKPLMRGPDGKFSDRDLMHIIKTGIEDPAGLILYPAFSHTLIDDDNRSVWR